MHARRRDLAGASAVIYLGANTITALTKLLMQRSGPTQRTVTRPTRLLLPSGHSTAAAAPLVGTALLLTARAHHPRRRTALTAVGLATAALVAMSRLILDVHWTTDVCVGLTLGTAWAALVALWSPHRASAAQA